MGRPLKADTPMRPISVNLTENQIEQLEQLAKQEKKTRTDLLREIVLKSINN